MRIVFGGVSHTATVFVNAGKVAHHEDAYTPFTALASSLVPVRHEMAVFVRNDFGPHSALHIDNDYYTYGGITRPVEWEILPKAFLERVEAVPGRTRRGWNPRVRLFGFALRKTVGLHLEISCAGVVEVAPVAFEKGLSLV